MPRIVVTTTIRAPIETCFDLACDVDVHCRTAAFTSERAVPPGRITGRLQSGDMVTFEGRHFGLRLRLTARVVEMQRPARFVDEMVNGPFRSLRHVHEFQSTGSVTEMVDTVDWVSPLGVIGAFADLLFVRRHMAWFIGSKQRALKELAESAP